MPQIKAATRTGNNAITTRRTVAVKQKVTANRKLLFFVFLPVKILSLINRATPKKKQADMWYFTMNFSE